MFQGVVLLLQNANYGHHCFSGKNSSPEPDGELGVSKREEDEEDDDEEDDNNCEQPVVPGG